MNGQTNRLLNESAVLRNPELYPPSRVLASTADGPGIVAECARMRGGSHVAYPFHQLEHTMIKLRGTAIAVGVAMLLTLAPSPRAQA
ncbi:MAG: hypothetical protein WBQ66_15860, partial [Blastocatellia bacterium]